MSGSCRECGHDLCICNELSNPPSLVARIAALERELAGATEQLKSLDTKYQRTLIGAARLETELAEARKELAQLREWHAAASKVMSDYVRDATPVIAEVEAAFRAVYAAFARSAESGVPVADVDAAWSRYQQERGKL